MQPSSLMNLRTVVLALAVAVVAVACKKEFDSPPKRELPVGSVMTIAQLKALFTGTPVRFPEPASVFAVVTADETDGNFYKNISVQDSTGGITLRLVNSGGLYIGDSIRIYLPGTKLSPYNGLMQLDSVDVDNNTIKQATGVHVEPLDITIDQLTATALDTLQSRLIRLNDVEFEDPCGQTWANAVAQTVGERYVRGCSSGRVMVRTSGYSSYAGSPLPIGRGSIVCVAGIFGSTIQLSNRNMAGVQMNDIRCDGSNPNAPSFCPILLKNFNDGSLTSGGWTQWSDTTLTWSTSTAGGGLPDGAYGMCRNRINPNPPFFVPGEAWLISPALDLTANTNPKLSFLNACNYTGDMLQVLVSTNYTGGNPNDATWSTLNATLSTSTTAFTWVNSGQIDLSPHSSTSTRIAFKYTGNASSGRTWEVDVIKITVD